MLSVVVPAFQAEQHLLRLLRAFESRPDWEIIVVDDGSTDGTANVARTWLASRQSGHLLSLSQNGPGAARQAGLDVATRPFITFADADDEVVVEPFDQGLSALERGGDVFIAGFKTRPQASGRHPRGTSAIRHVGSRRVLTSRAAVWGKIYRVAFLRSAAIRFPAIRSADDVVFSWRLAAAKPRVLEASRVGYLYWIDPHNQLTRDPKYFTDGLVTLSGIWQEASGQGLRVQALAAYAYATGSWHIARKAQPAHRASVLRASIMGLRRGGRALP